MDKVPNFYDDPDEKAIEEITKQMKTLYPKYKEKILSANCWSAFWSSQDLDNPDQLPPERLIINGQYRIEFLLLEILAELQRKAHV